MTQSSINNVTVYQGIMPILFGNTNLTNVCQWCGRLKQLTCFNDCGMQKLFDLTCYHTREEKNKPLSSFNRLNNKELVLSTPQNIPDGHVHTEVPKTEVSLWRVMSI